MTGNKGSLTESRQSVSIIVLSLIRLKLASRIPSSSPPATTSEARVAHDNPSRAMIRSMALS